MEGLIWLAIGLVVGTAVNEFRHYLGRKVTEVSPNGSRPHRDPRAPEGMSDIEYIGWKQRRDIADDYIKGLHGRRG